jgi:hypothetical protein
MVGWGIDRGYGERVFRSEANAGKTILIKFKYNQPILRSQPKRRLCPPFPPSLFQQLESSIVACLELASDTR